MHHVPEPRGSQNMMTVNPVLQIAIETGTVIVMIVALTVIVITGLVVAVAVRKKSQSS